MSPLRCLPHPCLSRSRRVWSCRSVTLARVALLVAGALVFSVEMLMAQPPGRSAAADAGQPRPCDRSARAIALRLVDDRTGAPVAEARVTLWREGAEQPLREASLMPDLGGRWILLADGDVALPGAEQTVTVWLQVERAGRPTVRHALQVGRDARGCHLALRGDLRELRV